MGVRRRIRSDARALHCHGRPIQTILAHSFLLPPSVAYLVLRGRAIFRLRSEYEGTSTLLYCSPGESLKAVEVHENGTQVMTVRS